MFAPTMEKKACYHIQSCEKKKKEVVTASLHARRCYVPCPSPPCTGLGRAPNKNTKTKRARHTEAERAPPTLTFRFELSLRYRLHSYALNTGNGNLKQTRSARAASISAKTISPALFGSCYASRRETPLPSCGLPQQK